MGTTELLPPSPFFRAWLGPLEEAARRGPVLDLACGPGRHALAAASVGARTAAIDRDAALLRALCARARRRRLPLLPIRADLERGNGIPVRSSSCGAILVFRFLHRPLAAAIAETLTPGGLLLYETFTIHQQELPHGPDNPAFLLREGELPELFPALEPLHFEELVTGGERPQALARLAARRSHAQGSDAPSGNAGGIPPTESESSDALRATPNCRTG